MFKRRYGKLVKFFRPLTRNLSIYKLKQLFSNLWGDAKLQTDKRNLFEQFHCGFDFGLASIAGSPSRVYKVLEDCITGSLRDLKIDFLQNFLFSF